jgi:hypothetical protein
MKILHLFFSLIMPDHKVTWLSAQFSMWRNEKRRQLLLRQEAHMKDDILFNCPGAGKLAISKHADHGTGENHGFGIGVSWGNSGYVGGVIGREEAKRLANHLLEQAAIMDAICSESESVKQMYSKMKL